MQTVTNGKSETTSDAAPQRPKSAKGRRRLRKVAYLAAILAAIEGIAWLADMAYGFQPRLLKAYQLLSVSDKPVKPRERWKPRGPVIRVRPPLLWPLPEEPHVVGGVEIAGADADARGMDFHVRRLSGDRRLRIFVTGGSAAFGFPYPYEKSFGAQLEQQLGADRYLVLIAAELGCTSGDLVTIAETIIDRFTPHALIIYVGNNEWIRWKATYRSHVNQTTLGVLQVLAQSRALAALQFLLLSSNDHKTSGTNTSGKFEEQFRLTGHDYALQHPLKPDVFDAGQWQATKQEFLDAYETNLRSMVDLAQQRKVRVVMLTVPFNYRLSPAWDSPQPEAFDPQHAAEVRQAIRSAAALIEAGDFEKALLQAEAAIELDPLPPILHYLKGECLERLERPLEAEAAFEECRENMIGNLGGRRSINERIMKVAREMGVELVDVKKLFDDYSHEQQRYFNVDLIHDDCHPTPLGHRLIAEALARLLGQQPNEHDRKTERETK